MSRPRYASDREQLHQLAGYLLDRRRKEYPQLVATGRMSQTAADRGILIMSEIQRSHAKPERPIWGETMARERRDALEKIAEATAKIAAAQAQNWSKRDFADAVAALLWWAERDVETERAFLGWKAAA